MDGFTFREHGSNLNTMNKKDAINHFGSAAKLARALGLTRAAITLWPERIPIGRQYQIEVVTQGKLVADREPSPSRAA